MGCFGTRNKRLLLVGWSRLIDEVAYEPARVSYTRWGWLGHPLKCRDPVLSLHPALVDARATPRERHLVTVRERHRLPIGALEGDGPCLGRPGRSISGPHQQDVVALLVEKDAVVGDPESPVDQRFSTRIRPRHDREWTPRRAGVRNGGIRGARRPGFIGVVAARRSGEGCGQNDSDTGASPDVRADKSLHAHLTVHRPGVVPTCREC